MNISSSSSSVSSSNSLVGARLSEIVSAFEVFALIKVGSLTVSEVFFKEGFAVSETFFFFLCSNCSFVSKDLKESTTTSKVKTFVPSSF
jgi:hypothetical protein